MLASTILRTCRCWCCHYFLFISLLVCWGGGIVLASKVFSLASLYSYVDPYLSEKLLAMRYDQVSFATTHNSYAELGKLTAGNQFASIQASLNQGVRALMLDVHWSDNTNSNVSLCHDDCKQGSIEIDEILEIIVTFLDDHPVNVVTIIWEIICTKEQTDCDAIKHEVYNIIEQSKLANMLYVPKTSSLGAGFAWPFLQEMIDNNEKIVLFFDKGSFDRPSHLNLWDHVIETPFDNNDMNDLDATCKFHRGTPNEPEKMLLNNHFTRLGLIPFSTALVEYNANPYMYNRMVRCQDELGKPITNFIVVDHWYFSSVINTVACLNSQHEVQTCESLDIVRILSMFLVSFMGGMGGILVVYGLLTLYRRLYAVWRKRIDSAVVWCGVLCE